MLGIKTVSEEAQLIVEMALQEELIDLPSSASGGAHAGIADILNRLDKSQTDEILSLLGEVRPDDVRALKAMLFSFEELATLDPKTRGVLMDKFPIERVVLALHGTDQEFQTVILSALGTRARRMVEAELSSGATPNPRDVQEARRAIVETVLQAAARGEVQLRGTIAGGEQAA
jgi:flagellar motor switch protein FliG